MRHLPLFALVALLSFHAAAEPLPEGKATPPVPVDHFPSRLHALVWRNWNLVPAGRLAAVVNAKPDDVRGLAASMGLAAERPIPSHYKARLYLTVLRRNWHLLPYPQLLQLVDMTPEQLAYVLREDDFFWAKLGYVKPKCEAITWAEPDAAAKARAAAIRQLVLDRFGTSVAGPAGEGEEEPLAFLKDFTGDVPDDQIAPRKLDLDHPRFLYSYFAVFGDPLSDPALDPYPDKLLARLAEVGVNGVWLHVVLRDLAPWKDFPEFGRGWEQRLAGLRKLVDRAKRFGIAVYLYQNEPRAMPEAFYKVAGRTDLAGVVEGEFRAMCTSRPEVRQWLTDSLAHVFSSVPDLGGVFTITASENLTNCASHHKPAGCPRCAKRKPAEIIAEVNTAIAAGVRKGSPTARTIVWDWGWKDEHAADIIAGLPNDVFFQSVSEWSLPLNRGGVPVAVGEYSISAVGPGPRATKHWALAKARGLKTIAKVQVNNTWELSTVPYLPTMDLVARHAGGLAGRGVDGLQLSWSLGGYPSPNLRVFKLVLGGLSPDAALDDTARQLFGRAGAGAARRAWEAYSAAFEQFPYHIGALYYGPQQTGPA
ncbi:MAG TPA: hypothetical protein VEA69_09755, partial [Tepidisphaeraceae bacterium]|nr:hypothetical protein [Tepidisphaeraceae bacterium]